MRLTMQWEIVQLIIERFSSIATCKQAGYTNSDVKIGAWRCLYYILVSFALAIT